MHGKPTLSTAAGDWMGSASMLRLTSHPS